MSEQVTSRRQRPIDDRWGEPQGRMYPIAEIVELSGVPASSIHHYLRAGLVPPPERTAANRFRYDERHVVALGIIRCLRQHGRTLQEIGDALPKLWATDRDRLDAAIAEYLGGAAYPPCATTKMIDAAVEELNQHGYGEVSVAAVCARAGVAKGTFYRHFDNKDQLFLAAGAAVIERAVVGFSADVGAGGPADAALFAMHLRPALPVLFELAKTSVQDPGPNAGAAISSFVELVERLGQLLAASAAPSDQVRIGGSMVVLAVVEIFSRLVGTELRRATDDRSA
ncbi:MAG: MerR family transcriptional regulator [Ilumatobacteraceae bacterium]|nr:MerR family transcriptional regulator [Ilumatobacteraceae bacterium]